MVLDTGPLEIHVRKRNLEKNLILAFDPGRDKIGFALVNFEGGLIFSGIFLSNQREKFFENLLNAKNLDEFIIENPGKFSDFQNLISQIKFVVMGNGTRSKEFQEAAKILPFEIKIVDERNTTLEARNLYWKLHKPGFFTRLLPEGLRVPPRVLDDLAAWAIAKRQLEIRN